LTTSKTPRKLLDNTDVDVTVVVVVVSVVGCRRRLIFLLLGADLKLNANLPEFCAIFAAKLTKKEWFLPSHVTASKPISGHGECKHNQTSDQQQQPINISYEEEEEQKSGVLGDLILCGCI